MIKYLTSKFNNVVIATYKLMGAFVLTIVLLAVLVYVILFIFYSASKSWAVPLVISPTQDKVLNHQAQVATFEQNFSKQQVDLLNAQTSLSAKKELLKNTLQLKQRLSYAKGSEAKRYSTESRNLSTSLSEKNANIQTNQQVIKEVNGLNADAQNELDAGLITKEQALSRKLELQSLHTSIINEKNQALELEHKHKELTSAANTLHGGSTNLNAFQANLEISNLNILIAQLSTDLITIEATINSLNKTVIESKRVLDVLKNSPYYLALRNPTNVAFITYDNLKNVKVNSPIYSCYLQIVFCKKVGNVNAIYEAEEYARHPMFKTDIKGRFLGVTFDDVKYAQVPVVFVNQKPLLF